MAITREQIQAAVEQYLPRTVNFARSSDLGEKDQRAIFKRVLQIVLIALLLDKDTVFYITFLSARRLLSRVDAVIALLEDLTSTNLLKSISPSAPQAVDNLGSLRSARINLLRVAGSVARGGAFNAVALENFTNDVTEFLTGQIRPNVVDRNRVVISRDVRVLMEQLVDAWDDLLLQQERVLQTVNNLSQVDLPLLVSSTVLSAVDDKLTQIEATISGQTTAQQAESAERYMIDLAAAAAALRQVSQPPEFLGTVVVPPRGDGFTEPTFVDVTGLARTQPIVIVTGGTNGRLHVEPRRAATTGAAFDDGDSDDLTPFLDDSTANFVSLGVTATDILTFADSGRSHRITQIVSPTRLRLSPEILTTISNARYLITELIPGSLFKDDTQSFWTEFVGTGTTPTANFTQGGLGTWVRDDKAQGVDGTNIKASGTGGVGDPNFYGPFSSGGATANNAWQDLSATYVTGGVNATLHRLVLISGTNAPDDLDITSVNTQTSLTVAGSPFTFPSSAETYAIRYVDGSSYFFDPLAAFVTEGVVVGDALEITSGALSGTSYEIAEVLSENLIRLTTGPFSVQASYDWRIRHPATVFVSEGSTFVSSGVVTGYFIHIVDGTFNETRQVAEVNSQSTITLTAAITDPLDNAVFEVFSSSGVTSKFRQNDGIDFLALVVSPGDTIQVQGTDFLISSLDPDSPEDTLHVTEVATVNPGPLSWSIRSVSETTSFEDGTTAPFLNLDLEGNPIFSVGDEFVIRFGEPDESRNRIKQIVSATEIQLTFPIETGLEALNYAVVNRVQRGHRLVQGRRQSTITKVVNKTTLQVEPPLTGALGLGANYSIVVPGTPSRTNRLVDDSVIGGFDPALVGARVKLNLNGPVSATIVGVADPDQDTNNEAMDLDVSMPLGLERVSYQVQVEAEGTTSEFLSVSADLSEVIVGDDVTVWGISPILPVNNVVSNSLSVDGTLQSGLQDLPFTVVRGGSRHHGRFLLLDYLLGSISLPETTQDLRLRVAEVLIDLGEQVLTELGSGLSGTIPDDDGDGRGDVFSSSSGNFISIGAARGDRLRVNAQTTYVENVVSETVLTVDPPIILEPVTAWSLDRTSVSLALAEAFNLIEMLSDLRRIVLAYVLPRNATIDGIISVLRDQNYDRAIDLLLDGRMDEFVSLVHESASYVSRARSASTGAGSLLSPGEEIQENLSKDRSLRSSIGSVKTTTSASETILGQPDAVVALASGTEQLVADERVQAAVEISLEEVKNRAIYELSGEVESGVITDTDPTLPWVSVTGSLRDRVIRRSEALESALQYIIDHPEEFEESAEDES